MLIVSRVRHLELLLSQLLLQLQQVWELHLVSLELHQDFLACLQESLASHLRLALTLAVKVQALALVLDEALAEEVQVLVLARHQAEEARDVEVLVVGLAGCRGWQEEVLVLVVVEEVVAILAEAVVATDQVVVEVVVAVQAEVEVAASQAMAEVAAVQVEVALAIAEEAAAIQAMGAEDQVFADEVHIALEAAHPLFRSVHLDYPLCVGLDTPRTR